MGFKGWDSQALEALQKRGMTAQDQRRLTHAAACAVPALVPDETETKIQQRLIRAFALKWPHIYASGALFAVPNQGKRNRSTASRMKAEGMVKGVADLILLWPSNGYHGAVLEMKAADGKASDSQRDWLAARERSGYKTGVENSFEGGLKFFEDYLNTQP